MHRLFQRQQRTIDRRARDEGGGIAEAVDHVEMGTCIGCANNCPRVAPDLHTLFPTRVGLAGVHTCDHGVEIVVDDDVDERVPLLFAKLSGNRADGETLESFPVLAEGLEQGVVTPIGERTKCARCRLGKAIHLGATGRVAQHRQLHCRRECHQLVPARQDVEHETTAQVEPQAEGVGQRERKHAATLRLGDIAAGELMLHLLPVLGLHLEQIPVERTIGCHAHRRHQIERLIGESANLRNELERRPRELAHHTAQRNEFLARAMTRRHRIARVIVMRGGPRRRKSHAASGKAVAQQLLHLHDLLRRSCTSGGIFFHHAAPDRGVTHEEPGIGHEGAVETVEVLAGGAPIPRHALL